MARTSATVKLDRRASCLPARDPKYPAPPAAPTLHRLQTNRPNAIVVGGSTPESKTLEHDLLQIRETITIDHPRFMIGAAPTSAPF
jgi:hypothetical protein